MSKIVAKVLAFSFLISASSIFTTANAADPWQEGQHYFLIEPARPKMDPTNPKVEVIEAFSYGCPACMMFQPIADKLKARLPANASFQYLHASFRSDESWPLFQRAFYAAQKLGVAGKTHQAMFDAIWRTGELAIAYPNSNRLKEPQPSLNEVAQFYFRAAGIKPEQFLATAKSSEIEARMRHADQLMVRYQADSTPTIIVNGKYRLTGRSTGGAEQLIAAVNWLVAKESAATAKSAGKKSNTK